MLNNADVAINLKLLKRFRFCHIFEPNRRKVFGRNAYRLTYLAYTVIFPCMLAYGSIGYFLDTEVIISDVEILVAIAVHAEYTQILWQAFVFLYHADAVWKMFDVARLNFLKSKRCKNNVSPLTNERDWSIRITNWFTVMTCATLVQWIIFPLVKIYFATSEDPADQRPDNILNLPFPVNVDNYNKYYFVFYAIEAILSIYAIYSLIIFDVYTISISRVIAIQFQVLTQAFESIGGHEETECGNNCNEEYEEFKSTLSDQLRFHMMLKSYYSVIKTIMLMRVALISSTIISLTYLFIVICSSTESISILNTIKVGCTIIYTSIQLFMYCYISNNNNIASASVSFGIYSCNWTAMDLKFKKLILLAMRINDATQLTLKVSPKRIIDLQLFAKVVNTCYNIVSVMAKTLK